MDRRAWKFKRATLVFGLALVVLANAVLITPSRADQCNCGSGCVTECPAPLPVLETLCGNSLFWHDPCGNGYRDPNYDCFFHDSTPPRWYVSAEFLPLFRDQSGSQPFQAFATQNVEVVGGIGGGTTITYPRQAVLSTSDFATDFNPGFRVLIGRALGDWYRLEGSYFGTHSWSDDAEVRYTPPIVPPDSDLTVIAGNMLSPLSNFGNPGGLPGLYPLTEDQFDPDVSPTAFDANQFASIRFRSRLDNGELNLRRRVRTFPDPQVRAETSCLVGLRYMNISEMFEYRDSSSVTSSPLKNRVTVNTENEMFGVQIGALAQFLVVDRGWIDFEIKGVMFFNEASNQIDASLLRQATTTTSAEKHRTTFMGDLSLNFNYQFAPSWTFRAGYNAMWLSGVALASENFLVDVNTLVTGPGSLDHSGNVVYHGPSIGLVFVR